MSIQQTPTSRQLSPPKSPSRAYHALHETTIVADRTPLSVKDYRGFSSPNASTLIYSPPISPRCAFNIPPPYLTTHTLGTSTKPPTCPAFRTQHPPRLLKLLPAPLLPVPHNYLHHNPKESLRALHIKQLVSAYPSVRNTSHAPPATLPRGTALPYPPNSTA